MLLLVVANHTLTRDGAHSLPPQSIGGFAMPFGFSEDGPGPTSSARSARAGSALDLASPTLQPQTPRPTGPRRLGGRPRNERARDLRPRQPEYLVGTPARRTRPARPARCFSTVSFGKRSRTALRKTKPRTQLSRFRGGAAVGTLFYVAVAYLVWLGLFVWTWSRAWAWSRAGRYRRHKGKRSPLRS